MKMRQYINKYINKNNKLNLLIITVVLVFVNSTCLYFSTRTVEENLDSSVLSFLGSGDFTYKSNAADADNAVDNKEKMSVELEIFQNILRYSKLRHDTAFKLAAEIVDNCEKYGVNPYLVLAVIKVESNFQPKAVSSMGAVGLMQLMPSTAKYVANKFDFKFKGKNSLFNPSTNVRLGIAYLSLLDQRYNNMEHALWAYNYGPARYKTHKKTLGGSLPYYVKQVMSFKSYLESEKVAISES